MVTLFYFITFAASVVLMGSFIFRSKRVDTDYILFCFMIFFNAMGRWLVAASETVEVGILSNKLLYFGGCYTPYLLIIVLARLSDIRLPAVLKWFLVIYSTVVFGFVLTIGHNGIYYRSVELAQGNGYHYLAKEYGPAYILYPVMMIFYVIMLLFLLVQAFRKRKKIAFGTVLWIGVLGFVVIMSYLLGRIFNSSIEWLSIGYFFAVIVISKLFNQINLYDMSTNIAIAVVNANENGFIVFDNRKRYVNSNERFRQLYPEIGEWQVEAVPPKFGSFFSDEIIHWFLDTGSTKEHKTVRAGGRYYEISVRDITAGRKNRKIGYLMEAADRTAEHNYTMKVEEAAHMANEANKAKSDFLAMVSHEIRTPLNAVIGMNEMILRESGEESVLTYANNAYNAGKTLLSIINNILDLSKIEAGKLEVIEEEYLLRSLVYDCYNLTADRAEKKGLLLTYEVEESLPAGLCGDLFHIRQIVVNFLTNAIKYTDTGKVEMFFSGKRAGDGLLLTIRVKDTGIGLTQENKERLFTSFQRFDLKRNMNVEGTGLGLSICKQLAELMSGTIFVESEYGKGSEFGLKIPQKIADATPIGVLSQTDFIDRKRAFEGNVLADHLSLLVVDDAEMNLLVFKSLLKGCGFLIDTAKSGAECLKLVREKTYDMIFMDHMMPEMDGIETFRKMKEYGTYPNRNTPVVMLTANAIGGMKEKYLMEGFCSYLSKPIDREKLNEILLTFLPKDRISYCEQQNIGKEGRAEKMEDKRWEGLKAAFPDADIEKGVAYCSGSDAFYIELLKDFTAPEKRAELQNAYQNEDWKLYTVKVHALKGGARTLGFDELGAVAEKLQAAGESGNAEEIRAHHKTLLGLLETLSECTAKL